MGINAVLIFSFTNSYDRESAMSVHALKNFLPCLPRHSSVNRVCYGYEGGALLVYLCNGQAIVYLLHFRVLCTKCLRICQKYLSNVIFLVAKLEP